MSKRNDAKCERVIATLLLSLEKALTRPELLPYMRSQILANTKAGLNSITEEELNEFLASGRSNT